MNEKLKSLNLKMKRFAYVLLHNWLLKMRVKPVFLCRCLPMKATLQLICLWVFWLQGCFLRQL